MTTETRFEHWFNDDGVDLRFSTEDGFVRLRYSELRDVLTDLGFAGGPDYRFDYQPLPPEQRDLELTLKSGEVLHYVPKEALAAVEAERDRLARILTRVKALAKEWKRLGKTSDYYGRAWYPAMARELRAALSDQEDE